MSGGDTSANLDYTAQNAYGTMSREIYDDYRARYAPIEADIISGITDSTVRDTNLNKAVVRAGSIADDRAGVSAGETARDLGRYGVTMTPEQQAVMDRRNALTKTASVAGNENRARINYADTEEAVMRGMVGQGRTSLGIATETAGAAAGLEANRNQTNTQIATQNQAMLDRQLGLGVGAGALLLL